MSRVNRWAIILGALMLSQTATAGSMRCGGHIIETGMRNGDGQYEVLRKCGEPKARNGNTWIYERGGKTTVVQFNDSGQISSIH